MNDDNLNEYENIDLNDKLTEEVVFDQLAEAFIVLENLIAGAKNSKDNLERIYELLDGIKVITERFSESLVSIENINTISLNMSKLDETLKDWVKEEVKMISALNSVLTEQKNIKDMIHKSNKKRIVEDIEGGDEQNKSNSGNTTIISILLVIIMAMQVASYIKI